MVLLGHTKLDRPYHHSLLLLILARKRGTTWIQVNVLHSIKGPLENPSFSSCRHTHFAVISVLNRPMHALHFFQGQNLGVMKLRSQIKQAYTKCIGKETAKFVQASLLEKLPFKHEVFDAVLATQVLHDLGDKPRTSQKHFESFTALRRVLNPCRSTVPAFASL